MYSTIVPAGLAWLLDPLDPSGATVVCGTRRQTAADDSKDGELRKFVGDQTQLVTFDSSTFTIPVTLVGLAEAQLAQVLAWKGQTLLLRLTSGRRFYGGYLDVSQTELTLAGPLWDVDVTFQQVSYSDAV